MPLDSCVVEERSALPSWCLLNRAFPPTNNDFPSKHRRGKHNSRSRRFNRVGRLLNVAHPHSTPIFPRPFPHPTATPLSARRGVMERESNPMQALCRSGCGFYGSPATDGLCSLCFKENLKKKQQLPAPSTTSLNTRRETATAQPTISHLSSSPVADLSTDASEESSTSQPLPVAAAVADSATSSVDVDSEASAVTSTADPDSGSEDKDGDKDYKKKKNRCAACRKKVGLTGFECRCGGLFCAVHRYSDKHDCSFNYREMGAQEIRRSNPVVVGEKIQKI